MRPPHPDPIGDPVQRVGTWNVANVLTMVRLALVPVFAVLLATPGDTARLWATLVFVVAAATDFVDGDVARRRGLVTSFGKVADPIADKALTGTALVGLSLLGELAWWVTAVILVREVAVTVLRFWVIRAGVIPASRGGKLKTALQILAIVLYLLPLGAPWSTLRAWVMLAAVVVTVATGVDYLGRAVALRRRAAAAGAVS